tara:strand:- start:557 stop:808 length:252 start_codon:yes stop_codon:yes gene_type:complete
MNEPISYDDKDILSHMEDVQYMGQTLDNKALGLAIAEITKLRAERERLTDLVEVPKTWVKAEYPMLPFESYEKYTKRKKATDG